MRGAPSRQVRALLALTPHDFIPADHPIRAIKLIVDQALAELAPVFRAMYSDLGRPSIPPEHLLKGSLLIALYSIRSERQFCERLQYDLLFKWFLDLNIEDEAFDASTFSKNRQRLLEHDVAGQFFAAVLAEARRRQLLSADHFTVDGTLLEAWASLKSVRPRDEGDGEGAPGAAGGTRMWTSMGKGARNVTHGSTTDPEAQLARKGRGKEAKLCFTGHVLMENRNGLVVDLELTQASGRAEREAALLMVGRQRQGRITVGADKGYDTRDFVARCRMLRVTPHVTQNKANRRSAIDGRTTRHGGYGISQRKRKRVEEIFGWVKTVGGGRKLRYIGIACNRLWATLTATAYNLVRIVRLTVPSCAQVVA